MYEDQTPEEGEEPRQMKGSLTADSQAQESPLAREGNDPSESSTCMINISRRGILVNFNGALCKGSLQLFCRCIRFAVPLCVAVICIGLALLVLYLDCLAIALGNSIIPATGLWHSTDGGAIFMSILGRFLYYGGALVVVLGLCGGVVGTLFSTYITSEWMRTWFCICASTKHHIMQDQKRKMCAISFLNDKGFCVHVRKACSDRSHK
jgi:hypothetical protein